MFTLMSQLSIKDFVAIITVIIIVVVVAYLLYRKVILPMIMTYKKITKLKKGVKKQKECFGEPFSEVVKEKGKEHLFKLIGLKLFSQHNKILKLEETLKQKKEEYEKRAGNISPSMPEIFQTTLLTVKIIDTEREIKRQKAVLNEMVETIDDSGFTPSMFR